MLVELMVMAVVLGSGMVISHASGFRGWGVVPWGYALGTFAYVVVGAAQVLSGVSTAPLATLVALPAIAVIVFWVVARRGRPQPFPWRISGWGLLAGAVITVMARGLHFTQWSYDSLRYLTVGGLLAGDTYSSTVSEVLLEKRLLAVGIIHAPAHLGGNSALVSATPLLAMSLIGLVIWFVQCGITGVLGSRAALYWGLIGAAVVLSVNRMFYAAFYINGHILVAVAVLAVVGGGWLIADKNRHLHRPLLIAMALGISSVIVARPDSVALMAVLIVPTLLTPQVRPFFRALPLISLGLTTVVWYAFSIHRIQQIGVPTPSSMKGFLVLGVIALAAVPLLYWRFLTSNRRLVMGLIEGVVWLAAIAVTVRSPGVVRASIEATWQNVVMGAGGWSLSLVLLALMLVAALVVFRLSGTESMRYALTTFLPLVIVFAVARGPAYRVGGGDSLNRSWTYVVAVAVVLLIATVAAGELRFSRSKEASVKDTEFTVVR